MIVMGLIANLSVVLAALMGLVLLGLHLYAAITGRGKLIKPSPLIVSAHEVPAKAVELTALAQRVGHIEAEIPQMEMRIIREIQAGNEKLAGKVEAIASGAYQGRQKLWDAVNEHREKISRLEGAAATAKKS